MLKKSFAPRDYNHKNNFQNLDPNLQNRMATLAALAVGGGNYQLVEVLPGGASKRIKNHYAQGITPSQVSR